VVAPLPASVLGIHVAVGDRVERGAPLVTLNAMKMELICEAPAAGMVEAIACRVGDLVAADQLLVTLRVGDVNKAAV
jgi:biotin carboxyl carrier protein